MTRALLLMMLHVIGTIAWLGAGIRLAVYDRNLVSHGTRQGRRR